MFALDFVAGHYQFMKRRLSLLYTVVLLSAISFIYNKLKYIYAYLNKRPWGSFRLKRMRHNIWMLFFPENKIPQGTFRFCCLHITFFKQKLLSSGWNHQLTDHIHSHQYQEQCYLRKVEFLQFQMSFQSPTIRHSQIPFSLRRVSWYWSVSAGSWCFPQLTRSQQVLWCISIKISIHVNVIIASVKREKEN